MPSAWFSSRPIWRILVLAVVPLALGLWFLFVPYLWQPYVRVPGSTTQLHLDCLPSELVIHAGPGPSDPTLVAVDGKVAGGSDLPERVVQQTPVAITKDRLSRFRLTLLPSQGEKTPVRVVDHYVAVVEFSRNPFVDIRSVELVPGDLNDGCRRETLSGASLAAVLGGDGVRIMRFRMIQDSISDAVLVLNSSVGNVILVGMLIGLVWTLSMLGPAFWTRYVCTEADLVERASKQAALLAQVGIGRYEVVRGAERQLQERLAMAKVLGPAFGFLLTVSSLAAALHPAVQGRQDAFQFVSAIQIAILSTLIGLAIRIVAQVAGAWSRGGTHRTLLAIEQEDKK